MVEAANLIDDRPLAIIGRREVENTTDLRNIIKIRGAKADGRINGINEMIIAGTSPEPLLRMTNRRMIGIGAAHQETAGHRDPDGKDGKTDGETTILPVRHRIHSNGRGGTTDIMTMTVVEATQSSRKKTKTSTGRH